MDSDLTRHCIPCKRVVDVTLIALLLLVALAQRVRAQDIATLVLIPSQIGAGGQLRIGGYNLDAGATYPISVDGPGGPQSAGQVITHRAGAFGRR